MPHSHTAETLAEIAAETPPFLLQSKDRKVANFAANADCETIFITLPGITEGNQAAVVLERDPTGVWVILVRPGVPVFVAKSEEP